MAQDPTPNHAPVNPLPPVVVALFLLILGVEGVVSLGGYGLIGGPQALGWRSTAIQDYGFNADILRWMLANHTYPAKFLERFVTFPFIHGSFTQALFGGALLLALGKFVGEAFGNVATFLVFMLSSIAGAFAFGLSAPAQPWLFGAFPGVYGLIGGFSYLMWLRLGQMGQQKIRAFSLIGALMGIQLVFALIFGGDPTWLADVAGFAAGFVLSVILAPGSLARLRDRLRQR